MGLFRASDGCAFSASTTPNGPPSLPHVIEHTKSWCGRATPRPTTALCWGELKIWIAGCGCTIPTQKCVCVCVPSGSDKRAGRHIEECVAHVIHLINDTGICEVDITAEYRAQFKRYTRGARFIVFSSPCVQVGKSNAPDACSNVRPASLRQALYLTPAFITIPLAETRHNAFSLWQFYKIISILLLFLFLS